MMVRKVSTGVWILPNTGVVDTRHEGLIMESFAKVGWTIHAIVGDVIVCFCVANGNRDLL